MDNIVKVNNILFEYIIDEVKFKVIDNLSLDVKKGEFVVIIGYNGFGKFILFKNLNVIFMFIEGNIFIDDMDIKEEERLWDIR